MRPLRVLTLSAVVAATLLAGCSSGTSPSTDQAASPAAASSVHAARPDGKAALASAVDTFLNGYFEHYPVFAAGAGKHEFDGKLPDFSAEGLQANAAWQQNLAGQSGVNSLAVLSRAKINF